MKFTINTHKFQEMLSKSMKGASCNSMIPITSLIGINLKNNCLTLVTSNGTNYLYIREDNIEADDFYIVVGVEVLAKLVMRTTSENITLELKDGILQITGNGKYLIELPLDENGNHIEYPDPSVKFNDCTPTSRMEPSLVKSILTTCKPALAVTMEIPCYTGYYMGNNIIGTDTYKICGINHPIFETPKLLNPEMVSLLDVFGDEVINIIELEDSIAFVGNTCKVCGHILDGIEDYAVDTINCLLDEEFDSMCKIPKSTLLNLLDRLSLFVGAYDKNSINLTFSSNGLIVTSKASSGTETIDYQDSKNFKDFACSIDIEMFKSQVKAQPTDMLEIWYGRENAIKLVNGNIKSIIALLED